MMRTAWCVAACLVATIACKQTIIVTPKAPDTAVFELDIELVDFGANPDEGRAYRSVWRVHVRELAGVEASFDFLRLELWNQAGDELERAEIGGSRLIAACGTTTVEASSEWICDVPLDFNTQDLDGRKVFTFGLSDVLGNLFELVLDSDASSSRATLQPTSFFNMNSLRIAV